MKDFSNNLIFGNKTCNFNTSKLLYDENKKFVAKNVSLGSV